MSHILWKNLVFLPVFLGANALASSSVIAAEILKASTSEAAKNPSDAAVVLEQPTASKQLLAQAKTEASNQDSMSQVTSVSQFSDVQPTDWAFQALQSLVERYGCFNPLRICRRLKCLFR
jgi:hypothetical protein